MLDASDWQEILKAIEQGSRQPPSIISSRVIQVDTNKRVLWVKDLNRLEIPIYAFEYEYETDVITASGEIKRRVEKVAPTLPEIGQNALILLPAGSRGAPKCIGVDLRRGIANAV